MRVSIPPERVCHSSSTRSPAMLTTLATSRPPGRNAFHSAGNNSGSPIPPPTKIASGGSSPASACGATPATILRHGTPSAAALRAIIAARSGCRSIATAEPPALARSHSIATEPQPAPMSHKLSPGRGARLARVIARISRLVSCPSCSNASSGSPPIRDRGRAVGPARHSSAIVLRSAVCRSPQFWASSLSIASRLPPRCSKTVRRLGPQPSPVSRRATWRGVDPSSDSSTERRCGAK